MRLRGTPRGVLTDCPTRTLPNVDVLRRYRQDDDTEFGRGSQRLAAELISPERRLRVVVNAMNTNPWADGEMRPMPVPTSSRLPEIATRPWWSRTLIPVEYIDAGEQLGDFDDGDEGSDAAPVWTNCLYQRSDPVD